MSTATARQHGVPSGNWQAGVVGGIVGSLVMGLLMGEGALAVAIPSLYGLAPPPNPLVGWVIHVAHGAVLGVVLAVVVDRLTVQSRGMVLGLGLAWGVVTWLLFAAVVMPIWLSAVGSPANPPLPNLTVSSLLSHAVYGLVLGAVYAVLDGSQ
jgi:hypothetical protein